MTCPHCAEKDERIAWLESELGLARDAERIERLHDAFGLTTAEAEVVQALHAAKGRILNRFQLLEATTSPSGNHDRVVRVVDVLIVRIRKKLGREAIGNVWGRGYRLTDAGMAKVAAILGETRQAAA